MKISELRKRLKDIKTAYGDIDVIVDARVVPYGSPYSGVKTVKAGYNGYNTGESITVLIR